MNQKDRLKLGISSCLLGEKVRYDGKDKLDRCLLATVGAFVDWVPVCPEVECGLPIPREAVHLISDGKNNRLVTRETKVDHTEKMQNWIVRRLEQLEKENLSGFIFKAKSPSCGTGNIEIYDEHGTVIQKGAGMFANAFSEKFPHIPVEEDVRLHDAGIREKFIEQIFTCRRRSDFIIEDHQ